MPETALKPCPFCGGKAEVVDTWECTDFARHIQCKKCGIRTQSVPLYQKGVATRVWNRRAKNA